MGVKLNDKGYIIADEFQNTTAKGVHALGDICGLIELTPMAIAAGRRLSDRLFGGMPNAKADYTNVPTVIFSHPPLATIGLTEREANTKFGEENINIYTNLGVNLFFSPFNIEPSQKQKTYIKLVCNKSDNDRVLGLHILGMGADEMMQGFGVAIKMGATKADFDSVVAIHPTASEEVVTLAPWGIPKK
eukprot:Trichotokara_eunicae@DN2577_c0_g1_i2.p1